MVVAHPATGQWFVSSQGTRWWFDSGAIALDFAYTGSMGDHPAWERWHHPGDAAGWFEERCGVRVRVTAAGLSRAKELRDAVATLAFDRLRERPLDARAVTLLDRWAREPDVAPQLGREPRVTLDRLLATLARDAVGWLRDHGDRVRECAAGDCAVVYLDTSRSGNRTWCSMQRCGNRHKVRQQRARRRAEGAHTPQEEGART